MKKALMPSFQTPDQPALARGNAVFNGLSGNPFYPTPRIALATLLAIITTYTTSLAKAEKGSSQDKAQKNADKATLIDLLRQQCDYVNETANGDPVALAGCGYELSKDRQPSVLGTATPSLEMGVSGQLISSTPGVGGAATYKHRLTTDPSSGVWQEIISTKATVKFDGLVPGTVYYSCIECYGTRGQVTISDVVSRMAA